MSASFLSPMVNGVILKDTKNLIQWQHCFLLSSVVAIVTYVMFRIYGTAEVQSWNYPTTVRRGDAESQQLNGTRKSIDEDEPGKEND